MLRASLAGAAWMAVASTSILYPARAEACGGFFCGGPTDPVVQTKEGIIFAVDHGANEVTAIINIGYQGEPSAFAWLLPLVVEPTDIAVGSARAFAVADQLTGPQFNITSVETDGMCNNDFGGNIRLAGAAEDATAVPPPMNKGVEVLSQEAVGPYDSVVLRGSDPEAVRRWLTDNGYAVTDEMMMTVVPYIAKGDVLLALKLMKGSDSGEVQPISVTMPGTTEACIPLRMTAIAALEDMDITAIVLSKRGRAIPDNYLHVTLNLAKIDWLNGGANYRQVVAQAADEGSGNAFTTEYSGTASIFKDQIFVEGQYDLASLRRATRLNELLQRIQDQGWQRRNEMRAILLEFIPELADCGSCPVGSIPDRDFDPNPLVDRIEERIVAPEREAQAMFDKYEHVTRLYTLISPDEMNIDPIFSYDETLPDVSNVHTAKLLYHCGLGGTPGSAGVEVILADGTQIAFENAENPDRSIIDGMPAAVRVESLSSRSLVADNSDRIQNAIDEQNSRVGGCGCAEARGLSGNVAGTGALIAAIAAGFVLRRRRR